MAWTSLKDRIDDLPLVLAGPILRRTEKDSVSVWIACKEKQNNLTLEIMEGNGTNVKFSGTAKTYELGTYLHVALITASDTNLISDKIYTYDITFSNGKLRDKNILTKDGNIKYFKYGNFKLPSFRLPAEKPENLHCIHGSCRKPHGGDYDAFIGIDRLLRQDAKVKRPQQLFLTGDQIYADDVAPALLFMIRDAGKVLREGKNVNPEESEHVGFLGEAIKGVTHEKIKDPDIIPGRRQDMINRLGLTSTHASSHLIFLWEFIAMYLFVWSDALWPEKHTDIPKTIKYKSAGEVNLKEGYAKTVKYIRWSQLKRVRGVLANVPSYMIFDDHEVTDDWFMTYVWAKKSITNNRFMKRVIINALSAYCIFQGWGNTPEKFIGGQDGEKVLQSIKNFNFTELEKILLPDFKLYKNKKGKLIEIKLDEEDKASEARLIGKFDFHYTIEFSCHTIIVLDTRTRRAYPNLDDPGPRLLTKADLDERFKNPITTPIVFIISPVPVFSLFLAEGGQTILTKLAKSNTLLPKDLVNLAYTFIDREGWNVSIEGFKSLMENLKKNKDCTKIILSGDIHFAYTSFLDVDPTGTQDKVVQCCSSAMKNKSGGTRAFAKISSGPDDSIVDLNSITDIDFKDIKNVKDIEKAIKSIIGVKSLADVFRLALQPERPVRLPVRLLEQILEVLDEDPKEVRDTRGSIERVGVINGKIRNPQIDDLLFTDKIVGHENFGQITFQAQNNTIEKVTHTLWFPVSYVDDKGDLIHAFFPLTKHEVEL